MEKRIRDYVNYQFRFEKGDDIENLKEEIIGNLTDRYYENLKKENDPEKAYIDAIKQLGDFTHYQDQQVSDDYKIKPAIPDILMLLSTILSIFGFVMILLNLIVGSIFTILSILLFSGSAYYFYNYSQYIRKNYMDIEKHNLYLKKIFKNIKTNFGFWTISLSLILTLIINKLSMSIGVFVTGANLDVNSIKQLFLISLLVFIFTFIVFIIIFYKLYYNLMDKYSYLTGDQNLTSSFSEVNQFFKTGKSNSPIMKNVIGIISILLIILTLFFTRLEYTYQPNTGYAESNFLMYLFSNINKTMWFINIPLILLYFGTIALDIYIIKNDKINIYPLIIPYWLIFLSLPFLQGQFYKNTDSQGYLNYTDGEVPIFFWFIFGVIFTIYLIVKVIMNYKSKRK